MGSLCSWATSKVRFLSCPNLSLWAFGLAHGCQTCLKASQEEGLPSKQSRYQGQPYPSLGCALSALLTAVACWASEMLSLGRLETILYLPASVFECLWRWIRPVSRQQNDKKEREQYWKQQWQALFSCTRKALEHQQMFTMRETQRFFPRLPVLSAQWHPEPEQQMWDNGSRPCSEGKWYNGLAWALLVAIWSVSGWLSAWKEPPTHPLVHCLEFHIGRETTEMYQINKQAQFLIPVGGNLAWLYRRGHSLEVGVKAL